MVERDPVLRFPDREKQDRRLVRRLSPQEQADGDLFIKTQRKFRRWEMPAYRSLGGGIGELRWESENKQHRLLGFFGDDIWYALIGCKHKQRIYTPPDCLDTARKRKRQIQNNEVVTVEYDL